MRVSALQFRSALVRLTPLFDDLLGVESEVMTFQDFEQELAKY